MRRATFNILEPSMPSKYPSLTLDLSQDYNRTEHLMVHDPASSLRTGDIISISSGWRVSKNVHHVVRSILAPFGEPIEARPPVPTEEERMAQRVARHNAKKARKEAREKGILPRKDSYTAEELRTIEERRQAKREKWLEDYEAAKGEKMPDRLLFRYMNAKERFEYAKANGLPVPTYQPVVKKEKVEKTPLAPPTPEELRVAREKRLVKRDRFARLYEERSGLKCPEWLTYKWMTHTDRKEWHQRDARIAERAEKAWREKLESQKNTEKDL
jgi:hypothetical protein